MTMWGALPTTPAAPSHPDTAATRVRPAAVVWACVLTWAGAGLGAVAMTAGLAYLALEPDTLLTEMRAQNPEFNDSGLSDRAILSATFLTGGLWAHMVPALAAKGLSQADALKVLVCVGPSQVVGRLFLLFLSRRFTLRATTRWFACCWRAGRTRWPRPGSCGEPRFTPPARAAQCAPGWRR